MEHLHSQKVKLRTEQLVLTDLSLVWRLSSSSSLSSYTSACSELMNWSTMEDLPTSRPPRNTTRKHLSTWGPDTCLAGPASPPTCIWGAACPAPGPPLCSTLRGEARWSLGAGSRRRKESPLLMTLLLVARNCRVTSTSATVRLLLRLPLA